jgi:protein-disulfide isomerase
MTTYMHAGVAFAMLAGAWLTFGAAPPAQTLTEGRAGSAVRVLIYEDLQCPDCADFRAMMDKRILPKYGDRVEFIHRDFPLAKHAWARRAAIAARFFGARDARLGLEYRRHTFATHAETTAENFNDRLAAFAREHGIPPADALAALDDPKYAEMVEKDYQDGVGRGVVHTPTVFVNGAPFVETFTFEEISKGLDDALAEAK